LLLLFLSDDNEAKMLLFVDGRSDVREGRMGVDVSRWE